MQMGYSNGKNEAPVVPDGSMPLQAHPYFFLFLIAMLLSLGFAAVIWTRRTAPGAITLFIHMLGLACWSGANAAMWLSTTLHAQLLWLNISGVGVMLVPMTFLLFSLQVSHHERLVTRRLIDLLTVEPLIGMALLWTNDYHHLVYSPPQLWFRHGLFELHWEPRLWFYVDTVYMYIIILAGVWFLARSIKQSGNLHRQQITIILAGACLLLLTNLTYVQPISEYLHDLDISPLTFIFSGGFYLYAMGRQKFLYLIPVAHSTLINSMTDGVVVLDDHDRILDMNPAAAQFLGITPGLVAGRRAQDILSAWRETTQPFWGQSQVQTEISVTGDIPRVIDLKVAPLLDPKKRTRGRMLVFRDITQRKQNEAILKDSNKKLKEQLDEIRALRDQLHEQATRDPLTNLYNRRYLEEMLTQELARASRENYPVCLIMMDIDRFKLVNDTCGHKAGDEVLQALATLIVLHIRRFDVACRFGGEEFVIVMPMLSTETAHERAEFLRREFAGMPLPCVNMKNSPTLSIGLASYPSDGINGEQLLNAADQALYAAKSSGRNRIMLYSELEEKRKSSEGKDPK
jgi:diguanylate cyclase (GGDEF)-like protein/PAS domain S-box-containing protein